MSQCDGAPHESAPVWHPALGLSDARWFGSYDIGASAPYAGSAAVSIPMDYQINSVTHKDFFTESQTANCDSSANVTTKKMGRPNHMLQTYSSILRLMPLLMLFVVNLPLSVLGENSGDSITLVKLTSASNDIEIQNYASTVKTLASNPNTLRSMSFWNLKKILYSLSGVLVRANINDTQWQAIRDSETMVIGLIVSATKSQIDYSVDVRKSLPLSYPAFEQVYTNKSDLDNPSKRMEYQKVIQQKIQVDAKVDRQLQARSYFQDYVSVGKHYLKLLYPEQTSNDSEFLILKDCGLDQKSVDMLTK